MELDHAGLSKLDLNLLVALDALIIQRSVTRAAAVVGVKQSAMSHSLGRLRRLLGDEILVRSPEGMKPTPRAMAILGPVRKALGELQQALLIGYDFDPATSQRRFRIGLPDSVEVAIAPALLAYFSREAPGCSIQVRSTDRFDVLQELDAGRLDLAIGVWNQGANHHKRRQLYVENYVVVFDKAPVEAELGRELAGDLPLGDYVRLGHVLGSHSEQPWGVVDEALKMQGLSRRIVMSTPHFIAIPFLLKRLPVVATLPSRLAGLFVERFGLIAAPAPLPLARFSVSMIWHSSAAQDPAQAWLRGQILRQWSHEP